MPTIVHGCDYHLKYALGLAGGMREIGCRVGFVTRDHATEFGGDAAARAALVQERLGTDGTLVEVRGRVRHLRPGPLLAGRRRVRSLQPDVVHLQDRVFNDPRVPLVTRGRPRRWALTVHDAYTHPGDVEPTRLRRAFDLTLLHGARLIFVHAESVRQGLIERYRPRAEIVVVPHGADPARPQPLPARPTLLFFGRILPYKGLDVLLDAMPRVWEAVPDARLVIAGRGERPEHPALADERVELRFEHVPESDVAQLFTDAGVVVLPYVEASQSGVGSQAKTYGRPSIVSDVGGLPELVADGSGLAVAARDPAALAHGAVRLLSDRALAERMGQAAADGLAAGAAWPRVARLTLDAYRDAGLLR